MYICRRQFFFPLSGAYKYHLSPEPPFSARAVLCPCLLRLIQEEQITTLQSAIDNNEYDKLKAKLDELEKAAQAMGEAMYQQQANAGQQTYSEPNNNNNSNGNNDDVVDADFKTK